MKTETYDFLSVEKKWQKIWQDSGADRTPHPTAQQKKFYTLVMFPYPSGKIHMGHARNYCIGDVIARYKKMTGHAVLHPLGWDAFGLPAENAAIERGIHPGEWTYKNIADMKEDIRQLGISYDWDREVATCDPEYYKWNQWIFIAMFKRGLVEQKESAVNWCPKCNTVLANEQVHEGMCWRCHSVVTQKELKQWFLKTTNYADRLLNDLDLLEGKWPDEVISMQKNWIGKSTGAEVQFELADAALQKKWGTLTVFTTRPDTLFGATFMVLAPEHPLSLHAAQSNAEIAAYLDSAQKKTRIERTQEGKDKTGVFSGFYAINPVNGDQLPIWIADYVLFDYGTGAIMAVPAHDSRDYAFAKKFNLKVTQVIAGPNQESIEKSAYEGDGVLMNSGEFDGTPVAVSKEKITAWLAARNLGKAAVNFRIRDWLVSRQRYWGTPIPMIHCAQCGIQPVAEKDLPVELPKDVAFTGQGQSPLAQCESFVRAVCPACGALAQRETDTMDTFVDSSWYFLRYIDPQNNALPFAKEKAAQWMPVDQYIGGIEHACMHLVYSRFWYKVLADMGLVSGQEPFERLLTQGMVTLGGSAMSKSKGNIVAVEKMVKEYGADTARIFVLFAAPPKSQLEWSDTGVEGAWRFLNRVWRLGAAILEAPKAQAAAAGSKKLARKQHWAIKKVQDDFDRGYQLNTAIAALMELLNAISDYESVGDATSRSAYKTLVTLLFPFAPHLACEIWESLGEKTVLWQTAFPQYDPTLLVEDSVEMVIQVNSKLKGKLVFASADSKDETAVLAQSREFLKGKGLDVGAAKHRFVAGRLINFIQS